MTICEKCGNPDMYWCENCESSQDHDGECESCGNDYEVKPMVVLDKEYHDNCNQYHE